MITTICPFMFAPYVPGDAMADDNEQELAAAHYLNVNNCKELDLEIAKELFNYDTEFRYQSCMLERCML